MGNPGKGWMPSEMKHNHSPSKKTATKIPGSDGDLFSGSDGDIKICFMEWQEGKIK